jgi:hypothetical protein
VILSKHKIIKANHKGIDYYIVDGNVNSNRNVNPNRNANPNRNVNYLL